MGLAQILGQAARAYGRVARARPMDLVRPARRMSDDDITLTAYGVGGIGGLGAAAIPSTVYLVNTDAERSRQQARMRFLLGQKIDGTPREQELREAAQMRHDALLEEIASLRLPPDGYLQSTRPRVFYPRPNTRRQDSEGYIGGVE
jgi:hypothetical protein